MTSRAGYDHTSVPVRCGLRAGGDHCSCLSFLQAAYENKAVSKFFKEGIWSTHESHLEFFGVWKLFLNVFWADFFFFFSVSKLVSGHDVSVLELYRHGVPDALLILQFLLRVRTAHSSPPHNTLCLENWLSMDLPFNETKWPLFQLHGGSAEAHLSPAQQGESTDLPHRLFRKAVGHSCSLKQQLLSASMSKGSEAASYLHGKSKQSYRLHQDGLELLHKDRDDSFPLFHLFLFYSFN